VAIVVDSTDAKIYEGILEELKRRRIAGNGDALLSALYIQPVQSREGKGFFQSVS
jgi:hypothetical protein